MMNTYDIETLTENEIVYPFCVSFILEKVIHTCYYLDYDVVMKSVEKAAKLSKLKNIVFYVHNLNFDGVLILECLFKHGIVVELFKKNLDIYQIKFVYFGNLFVFKCSYKLLPLSLNSLAKELNKQKGVFPYKFASWNNLYYIGDCPSEQYFNTKEDYLFFSEKTNIFNFQKVCIEYCELDVVLLKNVLEEIKKALKNISGFNLLNIFEKSMSAPSFSYKIYFKYYNKFHVSKKLNIDIYSYVKNSYFGGRCEVFGNPHENEYTYYYDFSGMYAQCMLEDFPVGDYYFEINPKNVEIPGFYCIEYIQNGDIPILPLKMNNKLLFVNGKMEGVFWYEEIKIFLKDCGEILKIKYGILFKKCEKVFKSFVEDFSKLRILGGYKKMLGKLIINSLYGGFGLKYIDSISVVTYSEKEFYDYMENTTVKSYYRINNCFLLEILKDKKSNAMLNKGEKNWSVTHHERNLIYASIITSKARVKLYNSISDVINEGGRMLYCDTDSIFAAFRKSDLKKCGKVIVWQKIYDDSFFISPKFYGVKNKIFEDVKIKGVSDRGKKFDEVKKIFYSNEERIHFENELVFYKKNLILKQKYIDKILWLNNYEKRVFSFDKKTTMALSIDDVLNSLKI